MTRYYSAEAYKNVIGDYTAYVWRGVRNLDKHLPKDGSKILSIGCGLGDIERLLDRDITCYDPYTPVEIYRNVPSGPFDYSYAYGGVISCALPNEKRSVIELALGLSPKFLVNTGLQTVDDQDECFTYTSWSEHELLADYNYKRVDRNLIEVSYAS